VSKSKKTEVETSQPQKEPKPMPFWLPFGKHFHWYLMALVLVAVVVLANIYPGINQFYQLNEPNTSQPVELSKNILVKEADLQTEIKSVSELEALLEKNVSAVEKVLGLIEQREKRSIEQLDGVAKTTLALDTRIQQLQAEVNEYKSQLAEREKLKSPNFANLSGMMVSLMDAYYRGDVTSLQLVTLHEQSITQELDEEFSRSIQSLIKATEGYGPITSAELMMLSFQILHQGAPEVEDLLSQQTSQNETYFDQARNYISKWVEVRKLDEVGENNPWVKGIYKIQNKIVQKQYNEALTVFNTAPFDQDKRLNALKEKIKVAAQQQEALKNVVIAFKKLNTKGE